MNGIDFLDGLSDIDPAYVDEAERDPLHKVVRWKYYASIAACLALMLTSGTFLLAGVGGMPPGVETGEGVASFISTPKMLFWVILILSATGVVVSLFFLIRKSKNQSDEV